MIVYKFGGALARSKRGLEALVRIMREAQRAEATRAHRAKSSAIHGVVLVTSALGHTTRHLTRAAELAEDGKLREAEDLLARVIAQHEQLALSMEIERERNLIDRFESIASEIASLLEGVAIVRELSPRSRDAILAAGERLAAELILALLEDREIPVRHIPSSRVMITDETFGHAAPQMEEIATRAAHSIVPVLRREAVALIEGFSGATRDGIVTTMGSESSDLSATLLAGVLGAREVVIWKLLPGLYTADPEFVKTPKLIRTMSFDEAEELGRRGARVLFPTFAHPLQAAGATGTKTILRIATPFSKSKGHTVLTHEDPISRGKIARPLAAVLEQNLVVLTMKLSEPNMKLDELRKRAIYSWESNDERTILLRREDRRIALRVLSDAQLPFQELKALAALAIIYRATSAAEPLTSHVAKSLRSFALYALVPVGRSVVALVDNAQALAALRKLHHDLFEG